MLDIITWGIIILGVVLTLLSCITFKRRGEFELSYNVTETTLFRIGVAVTVLGIIAKIVTLFFR